MGECFPKIIEYDRFTIWDCTKVVDRGEGEEGTPVDTREKGGLLAGGSLFLWWSAAGRWRKKSRFKGYGGRRYIINGWWHVGAWRRRGLRYSVWEGDPLAVLDLWACMLGGRRHYKNKKEQ